LGLGWWGGGGGLRDGGDGSKRLELWENMRRKKKIIKWREKRMEHRGEVEKGLGENGLGVILGSVRTFLRVKSFWGEKGEG
jgi:hypothetical protein